MHLPWEGSRQTDSKAEGELRLFAHALRSPGRSEDHFGVDALHSVQLPHELLHLLGDLRPDRAARRGEREGDEYLWPLDLDVVHKAELDEVEAQLGVDHVRERFGDFVLRGHGYEVSRVDLCVSSPSCSPSSCSRSPSCSSSTMSWSASGYSPHSHSWPPTLSSARCCCARRAGRSGAASRPRCRPAGCRIGRSRTECW